MSVRRTFQLRGRPVQISCPPPPTSLARGESETRASTLATSSGAGEGRWKSRQCNRLYHNAVSHATSTKGKTKFSRSVSQPIQLQTLPCYPMPVVVPHESEAVPFQS